METMTEQNPKLPETMFQSLKSVPRTAWLLGFLAGALSVGVDIAAWKSTLKLDWLIVSITIVSIILDFAGLYIGATGVLRAQPTLRGYGRFLASFAAIALPAAGIAGFVVATKSLFAAEHRMLLFSVGVVVSLIMLILLAAWPLAQAQSGKIISPVRVFRATSGHRWGLYASSLMAGIASGGTFLPEIASAKKLGQAVFFASGHLALGLFSFGLTASLMAAALVFAGRNDETLAALVDPAEMARLQAGQ
jgi:hypothetical protein